MTDWTNIREDQIIFSLIDFQTSFSTLMEPKIYNRARSSTLLMIKLFKRLNIPLIGTEHYPKGLGATDPILLEEWGTAPMYQKMTFSCYGQENYIETLSNYSRPVVILGGLETHICVLQTALDLLKQNYKVIVPIDAVLSSTKSKWKNGLSLMEKAGATLMNVESILFYLLKRADTPEFKHFVKLLKEANASL